MAQAASFLNCSVSYVYRLIDLEKCKPIKTPIGGDLILPETELNKVAVILTDRQSRLKERRRLEALGRSPDAARKAVYRVRGKAPRI